jgi:hypothetical protein
MFFTLLPLPPAIAFGLPWRMNFRSGRPATTLDRFADEAFVASLTDDERKHCEAAIASLLERMLASRKIPRTLSRAQLNLAASQKIWDERSPAGIKVSLGSTRFTVLEGSAWIGDSVNRLVKGLRPDPGTKLPEFKTIFTEADWEDIGHRGAAPTSVGGPKPRKTQVRKPAPELDLSPPTSPAQRRKRQVVDLQLITASGRPIRGNDYRLGWLLTEVHKVVALNQGEPLHFEEAILRLNASAAPGAAELASILSARLDALETAQVPEEIRDVLSLVFNDGPSPDPWTEESLFWAFGVAPTRESFDSSFWGGRAPLAFKLRRKLRPMTDTFITNTLHSPALEILSKELAAVEFAPTKRLQSLLGPLLGGAHGIGVIKFLTEVLGWQGGQLVTVPVSAGVDEDQTNLFFWRQAAHPVGPARVLEICLRARQLTFARGAFELSEVASPFTEHPEHRVTEDMVAEILSEWPAVRWLSHAGFGVVEGVGHLPGLVEQMLNVAWPRPLHIDEVVEAIPSAQYTIGELRSAQARLHTGGLVPNEILIEALDRAKNIVRSGERYLALKSAPAQDYFEWRPVELDLVEYLQSVGGTALTRNIYKRFQDDKAVDPADLGILIRAVPYLYSPTPVTTAVRPWAVPSKPH